MNNPYFNCGEIIGGERFLGRKREIRRLQERLLGSDGYASAAIIGMPRIGKSSLIQKAILDGADELARARKIVAIRLDVGTQKSFGNLLTEIVRETMQKITESGHAVDPIEKQAAEALRATPDQQWYEVRTLLRLFKKSGIRVIGVLDEFDAGRHAFSGNPQSFHLLRELGSNNEFKIGLVLVSKRDLAEISRQAGHPSDYWANVLKTIDLGAFVEDDMAEYFASLNNAGIACNPALRAQIVSHSGAHPFILDQAACEAWDAIKGKEDFGAAQWSATIERLLRNLFGQIASVLQGSPSFNSLCQITLNGGKSASKQDIENLIRYGLLVRSPKGQLRSFAPSLPDYLRSLDGDPGVASLTTQEVKKDVQAQVSAVFGAKKQDGPFQFDHSQTALKAVNGIVTKLPPRFGLVIHAMLKVDSLRYGTLGSSLSYDQVAIEYAKGQVEEEPVKREALVAKVKKHGKEAPKIQAQQFKRDFGRWLAERGIDIDEIVVCDSKQKCYRIQANGWDPKRPVLYNSAPGQLRPTPSIVNNVAAEGFDEDSSEAADSDDPV